MCLLIASIDILCDECARLRTAHRTYDCDIFAHQIESSIKCIEFLWWWMSFLFVFSLFVFFYWKVDSPRWWIPITMIIWCNRYKYRELNAHVHECVIVWCTSFYWNKMKSEKKTLFRYKIASCKHLVDIQIEYNGNKYRLNV